MSNIIDLVNAAATEETSGPLDPCPYCGARPHEAPEGVHDVHSAKKHPGASVGDPKWNFDHCWKCGYRPGTNVAVSDAAMRRAFEQFKQMYDEHLQGLNVADPRQVLSPPPTNPQDAAALNEARAEIAELQRQLAVINANKDKSDGDA